MKYLRDHYELGACYYVNSKTLWMLTYVRKDSAHRDVIRSALTTSTDAVSNGPPASIYGFGVRHL